MGRDNRKYNQTGPDFDRYDFSSDAERTFVQASIKNLIRKIVTKRKEKGLSQERFAELTGMSHSTIRSIENLQRIPSLPVLMKIMYILDKRCKIW